MPVRRSHSFWSGARFVRRAPGFLVLVLLVGVAVTSGAAGSPKFSAGQLTAYMASYAANADERIEAVEATWEKP